MSFLRRIYCFFFGHKAVNQERVVEVRVTICDYCGYPADETHPPRNCG